MADRKWKILLVDDEPSIIKTIGKRLEVEGFEVLIAIDGEEAIRIATAEHPDVIVLDLMLPKVDGFQVCQTLKKDKSAKDIPIITVFSGRGNEEDQERCRSLGAAAYVQKGHGATPLLDQIRNLLSHMGDD